MRNVLSAAVLGALLATAGCKSSGELRVDVICAGLCPCLDPEAQEQCLAECTAEVSPSEISDECLACFAESDSCFDTTEICLPICAATGPDGPELSTDAPLPL